MTGLVDADVAILAGLVLATAIYTGVRHPDRFRPALRIAARSFATLLPVVVLAILAAGFLGLLVPREAVAPLIGEESGLAGILVASVVGALIPGGPMISFPLAATFAQAGAGAPQLVALISGWTVVAVHRLVALEIPLMGRAFVVRRLAATVFLAPLSGVIAAGLLSLAGAMR